MAKNSSVQLCVLGFRRLEDRDIRIGVLPNSEEILIRGASFGVLTLQCERAAQIQTGQWVHNIPSAYSLMIQNTLEFCCGLYSVAQLEVRHSPQVIRHESALTRPSTHFIRPCGL